MKTTAGICSNKARYLASRFGACASARGSWSLSVKLSRTGFKGESAKTLARSRRTASASAISGRSASASTKWLFGVPTVRAVDDMFTSDAASSGPRLPPSAARPRTILIGTILIGTILIARKPPPFPPDRLFIERCLGKAAQGMNGPAISLDSGGRQQGARWLIHERHKLVGKSRHGASDADTPDIGATAEARHPTPLAHIALHHRPPASQLHDAQRRPILFGKLRLLIVASTITAFMDGPPEEPGGTQGIIERDHGGAPGGHVEKIKERLHEVVRLDGASGNTNDGDIALRAPLPTKVIGQPHASGGIAFHGMNSAVGRAGPGSNHCPCFRRQPIDPLTSGYGLTRCL